MLPRLKPKKFYDLVIQVAIVRPGSLEGDMVHPYLRPRQEKEKVVYPSPAPPHDAAELKGVLGRTLGVPLFHNQDMKIGRASCRGRVCLCRSRWSTGHTKKKKKTKKTN